MSSLLPKHSTNSMARSLIGVSDDYTKLRLSRVLSYFYSNCEGLFLIKFKLEVMCFKFNKIDTSMQVWCYLFNNR